MSPDQQNPYTQQPLQPPSAPPQGGQFQQPQVIQPQGGQPPVMPVMPAVPNNGHSGHNPYEFIMNHNAPKSKLPGLNFGGGSFVMRLAVLVGGAVVMLTIGIIVISALAPKGSIPGLTAMAERQQEIIRITDLVDSDVQDQDTKNLVANVNAAVNSDQLQVLTFLGQHGAKLGPKTLVLDRDSQTDALLDSAASAGTYDTTAVDTLATQLATYESLIRSTLKDTTNKQAQKLLKDSFASTDKLLTQAKTLQPATTK